MPVAPLSGNAALISLFPWAFNAATLFIKALDVVKDTGFKGIFHVNDCITLLLVTHWP